MTQLGWFRYQKIWTRKNSRFNSFYRFNFLPRQTTVVEVDTFDPFVISITAQIGGLCQLVSAGHNVLVLETETDHLKNELSWAELLSGPHLYLIFIGNVNCAWHYWAGGASSDTSWMQFKSILFLIAFHDTDKNPPIYPSYQTCALGISTGLSSFAGIIVKYHCSAKMSM